MAPNLKESHSKCKWSDKYTQDHNLKQNFISANIEINTTRRACRMWLVGHRDQRYHERGGLGLVLLAGRNQWWHQMENVLQEGHGSLAPSSQCACGSPACRSEDRCSLPECRAPAPRVGRVLSGTKDPALTRHKTGRRLPTFRVYTDSWTDL